MLLRGREHEVDVEPREEHEPRARCSWRRSGRGSGRRRGTSAAPRRRPPGRGRRPGTQARPCAALATRLRWREHGALGDAGRAARVLDHREVVDGRARVPTGRADRARAGRTTASCPGAGPVSCGPRAPARWRDRQPQGQPLRPAASTPVRSTETTCSTSPREPWTVVGDLVPGDGDGRPVVLELVAQLASACRAGCARRRRRRAAAPRRTRRCAAGSSAARARPGRPRATPRRRRPSAARSTCRRARRTSARRRRTRAPVAAPYAATAPVSRSTSEVTGGSISAGTPSA